MALVANTIEERVASCAGRNLRVAARAVTRYYDDVMRPSGLRVGQFSLLAIIKRSQPVTVTRLAELSAMDRTTLTRNLKPLEKDGLIDIRIGADKRVREIIITKKGKLALRHALPLWAQAQNHLTEGLGEVQLRQLLAALTAAVEVASH